MAKRLPGKPWFKFKLFGLDWEARLIPVKSKVLDRGKSVGVCFYNARWIGVADWVSLEQQRVTLAHELEHAIEDHAGVEHDYPAAADVADRWTDQIALGWLYLIRHCPEIVAFLRAE